MGSSIMGSCQEQIGERDIGSKWTYLGGIGVKSLFLNLIVSRDRWILLLQASMNGNHPSGQGYQKTVFLPPR